jgi:hypothetical protein
MDAVVERARGTPVITDRQWERLKARIAELERALRVYESALQVIADKVDVEIDLDPAPTEEELFMKKQFERSSRALLASDEVKAYLEESVED